MSNALAEQSELQRFLGGNARAGIYAQQLGGSENLEPICVDDHAGLSDRTAEEITRRYVTYGFARLSFRRNVSEQTLTDFAAALGLGEPFVPPMYRRTDTELLYETSGVNVLTASATDGRSAHPAFTASNGQELHSDGTLQPIGFVQTALLICVTPAAEGGESLMFNSVGAFCRIAELDFAAARTLTSSCLRRTATVGPIGDTHLGPAFALRSTELVARYSVTHTDTWDCPVGVQRGAFERAIAKLQELSLPSSPWFTRLALGPSEGLLMANDKIAHGRTTYRDTGSRTRKMLRGLFLHRPSSSSVTLREELVQSLRR